MKYFSAPQNHRAFTLIELLVVISIISSLSSVVLTSLNGARAKARDTVRINYVRQIDTAIKSFKYDNNDRYPPQDDPGNANGSTPDWGYNYSFQPDFLSVLVTKKYISQTLRDPLNPDRFFWYLNNDGNVGGVVLDYNTQDDYVYQDCGNLIAKAVFMFLLEGEPSAAYPTITFEGGRRVNVICYY